MAFQNTQQPTEEPWGPNISEEQSDDEAAGGGVDLDATEKEDNHEEISYFYPTSDEESEGGGEVARQRPGLPVSPVVLDYLQRKTDGEKKKKSCLEDLKVRDWLHQNAEQFPIYFEKGAQKFIRKMLCLPPEMSADKVEELFVRSPKLVRALLLTVHYYATHSMPYTRSEPALQLAYLLWFSPCNPDLRNMLDTAQ